MSESPAEYEAVVYDLDGTLVRLAVDWETVEREVAAVLLDAGIDPDELVTWELLDVAEQNGVGERVNEIIAGHERAGAERAEILTTAEELLADDVPTGVVSLNAEAAVRIALETTGLIDAVDVVVGRDTLDTRKPDPTPLLTAIERLAVSPETVLFVGDSDTDEETARRAGVDFRYV